MTRDVRQHLLALLAQVECLSPTDRARLCGYVTDAILRGRIDPESRAQIIVAADGTGRLIVPVPGGTGHGPRFSR